MKSKIIVSAVCLVILTACHKPITVNNPNQPASIEQQVYADLIAAQTAIEGLKAQANQFPNLKPELNKAIASYNVAELAFTGYEKSKSANLAKPEDLLDIQQSILTLEAHINQLGESFKPAAAGTVKETK